MHLEPDSERCLQVESLLLLLESVHRARRLHRPSPPGGFGAQKWPLCHDYHPTTRRRCQRRASAFRLEQRVAIAPRSGPLSSAGG